MKQILEQKSSRGLAPRLIKYNPKKIEMNKVIKEVDQKLEISPMPEKIAHR